MAKGILSKIFSFLKGLIKIKEPTPVARQEQAQIGGFYLKVADMVYVTGRGLLVSGQVQAGPINKGEFVTLTLKNGLTKPCKVLGIEIENQRSKRAEPGDQAGLILSGIGRNDIDKGTIIRKI
tara:strand:- start:1283 stop:1651 length:369 start_codon:yes stop_codon:yes gene_type:complete